MLNAMTDVALIKDEPSDLVNVAIEKLYIFGKPGTRRTIRAQRAAR